MKVLASAIAGGVLTLAAHVAAAQEATVEDIRVHLFYERSGKLSDDLTRRQDIALWNIPIGEGEAEGPANSFLVAAVVRGKPKSFFDQPADLTITVTLDDKRKTKVTDRTFSGGILFGPEGQVVKAMMMHNRVCVPLVITAKLKSGSSKTVNLPFKCGERPPS
jgi:hypothetical protein